MGRDVKSFLIPGLLFDAPEPARDSVLRALRKRKSLTAASKLYGIRPNPGVVILSLHPIMRSGPKPPDRDPCWQSNERRQWATRTSLATSRATLRWGGGSRGRGRGFTCRRWLRRVSD